MAKILITGGTGFAASHLVEALYQKGQKDLHLTAYKDEGEYVKQFVSVDRIHQLNLTDFEATKTLIEQIRPDQIYHLASIATVGDSFEKSKFVMEMNISLQLNLLEAIKTYAPKSRLLHISTALVYDKNNQALNESSALGPDNPYALSKLTQDLMTQTFVKSEGFDAVIARPFNHIGERQVKGFVIADLVNRIVNIENGIEDKLLVGNLSSIRDFSDVKDMVKSYILLMEKGEKGEIYNIGSGVGRSIQSMLDLLISLSKTNISIEIDPNKIRPVDLPYLVCDNEKIRALGWRPEHELKETLERILNYWRQNL